MGRTSAAAHGGSGEVSQVSVHLPHHSTEWPNAAYISSAFDHSQGYLFSGYAIHFSAYCYITFAML